MAEIRMDREGSATPRSELHRTENVDGGHLGDTLPAGHALPGGTPARTDVGTGAGGVVSGDPQAVRAEIEHTRERMSETIDEIEGVLARKKEQLQERLDVTAPIRERPLPAAGIAFGAGLVLGLLTGGDDHEEPHARTSSNALRLGMDSDVGGDLSVHADRAALWENRARRLLRVAREQEEQIRQLQERYGSLYARDVELRGWETDEDAANELRSSVGTLRDTVLHGITGMLTDAFHQMGKSR